VIDGVMCQPRAEELGKTMSGSVGTTLRINSPLKELEQMLGTSWNNIESAQRNTDATLEQLGRIVEGLPGPDSSIVVHGSLARRECTQGSDLDWTLLVDGQANASDHESFLAIKNAFDNTNFAALGLKDPGREGTFGKLTFSQTIMHFIGGEEDSNSNTTRRVLLLLEGLPIGERQQAFERVRHVILRRYLDEDRGLLRNGYKETHVRWIPLFLLNDFSRYWRTMAVDFAYKQFNRGSEGYALRSIKLGMSRKLLFASGLLACFWCDPGISKDENQTANKQSLINNLDKFLSWTPLERLALFFTVQMKALESEFLRETAIALFGSYDEFLGLLNDHDKRKCLEQLRPDDEETDTKFQEARIMRRKFRIAIQNMFLNKHSPLHQHSIEKGVF
jgi:hypothetical protein